MATLWSHTGEQCMNLHTIHLVVCHSLSHTYTLPLFCALCFELLLMILYTAYIINDDALTVWTGWYLVAGVNCSLPGAEMIRYKLVNVVSCTRRFD